MWPRNLEHDRLYDYSDYIGKTLEQFQKDNPKTIIQIIEPNKPFLSDYIENRICIVLVKGVITRIYNM